MSTAICAYLLHSKRRHLLPNLMELLRHDVSGQEAIGIAYQITIDQLLTDR